MLLAAFLRSIVLLAALLLATNCHAPPTSNAAEKPNAQRPDASQIRTAFAASHDGYSSDELLVRDELRDAFLRQLGIDPDDESRSDDQTDALLQLLKIRKSGKLDVPTRRRFSDQAATARWTETAELAIRTILDRHGVTIDTVLCDPRLRAELQAEATAISPDAPADLIRKAVLKLRKIRRLRPELVLRVAQWQTEVLTINLTDIDLEHVPDAPGIYLFGSEEGYLYIGEAESLSVRIAQHLAGSHNSGLAGRLKKLRSADADPIILELHVFAKNSPGNQLIMRRAYESELIRSRNPKFNLRP